MVTTQPPGSLPGIIHFASTPAIRPKTTHDRMPMAYSPFVFTTQEQDAPRPVVPGKLTSSARDYTTQAAFPGGVGVRGFTGQDSPVFHCLPFLRAKLRKAARSIRTEIRPKRDAMTADFQRLTSDLAAAAPATRTQAADELSRLGPETPPGSRRLEIGVQNGPGAAPTLDPPGLVRKPLGGVAEAGAGRGLLALREG